MKIKQMQRVLESLCKAPNSYGQANPKYLKTYCGLAMKQNQTISEWWSTVKKTICHCQ